MNGKNIVRYRKDNGLSQLELANKLGIAKSTLSSWENNKTTPKGNDYERLLDEIGSEYLIDSDLTENVTTVQAIGEVSDIVNDILYQVSNIGSNQQQYYSAENRSELRHRRIRTAAVLVTCLIIILVFFFTWFFIVNHGISGDVIEGSIKEGTPSYFEYDDK